MKFFIDNISNVWLLAIVLVSGGMLLWPILQRRGAKVSILQATQLFNQGKTLLLDVREEAEFAAGHVHDAKNIPLKQLPTTQTATSRSETINATIPAQSWQCWRVRTISARDVCGERCNT